jgi:hypothetical protein
MACKFPAGHPDENNNFGNAGVCSRYGGTWVTAPSLMSAPTSGKEIPMTGINPEWDAPLQGGAKYGDPTDAILTGAMLAPVVGPAVRGAKLLAPKVKPVVDKAVQSLFKKKYNISKGTGKTPKGAPVPLMQGPKQKLDRRGRPMFQKGTTVDPMKVAGFTGGAGLIVKNSSLFDNPYEGQTGPVTDKKVVQPIDDTKPTDKPNVFNGGEPTGEEVKKVAKGKDIPDSIWDKMKTKDYWMTGMEGGSGGWDNRLFRLGEMMSYMGTPISKRGDNPAKRWTTAATASSKAAKDAATAAAKANKPVDIFSKISNPTMVKAIKEKVANMMGKNAWLSLDPDEADVEQTANEAIIAIQSIITRVNPATNKKYTYREAEQMVLDSIK